MMLDSTVRAIGGALFGGVVLLGVTWGGCFLSRSGTGPPDATGTAGGGGTTSGQGGSAGGQGGSTTTTSGQGGTPVCDPLPDEADAGAECATAHDVGPLSDVAGDHVVVEGNGYAGDRQMWWTFEALDDEDTEGDEFHVDIHFIHNPGGIYRLDVFRNSCSPLYQIATAEPVAVDWFTDFATTSQGCTLSAPCGEGDCAGYPGEEGKNRCNDNSARFYVRVTQAGGVVSCEAYELEMSNGYYATHPPTQQ
jgi:hypothetical protein